VVNEVLVIEHVERRSLRRKPADQYVVCGFCSCSYRRSGRSRNVDVVRFVLLLDSLDGVVNSELDHRDIDHPGLARTGSCDLRLNSNRIPINDSVGSHAGGCCQQDGEHDNVLPDLWFASHDLSFRCVFPSNIKAVKRSEN
jgi:hypothetical protein